MITFAVSATASGTVVAEWDGLDAAGFTHTLSDHLRLDLERARRSDAPPRFIAVSARAGRSVDPAAGAGADNPVALVGYGQVSGANDADLLEIAVGHGPRVPDGLGEQLFDTAVDAQRTLQGDVALRWWTDLDRGPIVDTALGRGFQLERRLYEMSIALDADVTDADVTGADAPYPTRSFDAATDPERLLELNNRSFAGHGEQGGWTMGQLRQRLDEPWFRPERLRIVESDGRLVGFCWTKPHGPDVGEIYIIGVDPDVAGQGLGTTLVTDGLRTIAAAGATTAILWVDADNEPAVRMYRRLGFQVARTRSAFLLATPDGQKRQS